MSVFKLTVNIDDKVKWDAHTFATAHKMTLSELVEKALLSYIRTDNKNIIPPKGGSGTVYPKTVIKEKKSKNGNKITTITKK